MKKIITTIIIGIFAIATISVGTYAWLSGISIRNFNTPLVLEVENEDLNMSIDYNLYQGNDFDLNGTLDTLDSGLSIDTISVDDYISNNFSVVKKNEDLNTQMDDNYALSSLLPGNILTYALKLDNLDDIDYKLDLRFGNITSNHTPLTLKVYGVEVRKYNDFTTSYYNSDYTTSGSNITSSQNLEFLQNGELFMKNVEFEAYGSYLVFYKIQILNLYDMQTTIDRYYYNYFNSYYENYLEDYLSSTPEIVIESFTDDLDEKLVLDTDYTLSVSDDGLTYTFTDLSADAEIVTLNSVSDTFGRSLTEDIDYTIVATDKVYTITLNSLNYFTNHYYDLIDPSNDTDTDANVLIYQTNLQDFIAGYIYSAENDFSVLGYQLTAREKILLENIENLDFEPLKDRVALLTTEKNNTTTNTDDNEVHIESLVIVIKE